MFPSVAERDWRWRCASIRAVLRCGGKGRRCAHRGPSPTRPYQRPGTSAPSRRKLCRMSPRIWPRLHPVRVRPECERSAMGLRGTLSSIASLGHAVIAVRMIRRHTAFVDPIELQVFPGNLLPVLCTGVGEHFEGIFRGVAAGDGDARLAPGPGGGDEFHPQSTAQRGGLLLPRWHPRNR